MPNISEFKTQSSVLRGSRGGVLAGNTLSDLIQQRHYSLDWYSYFWQCNSLPQDLTGPGDDPVWVTADNPVSFGFGLSDNTAVAGLGYATPIAGNFQASLRATGAQSISGTSSFWDPAREPGLIVGLATDSNIIGGLDFDLTNRFLAVGFKTTDDPEVTADPVQAMWYSDPDGVSVPWSYVVEPGGPPTRTGNPPTTTTNYELAVLFDRSRRPHFYFDGGLVAIGQPIAEGLHIQPTVALRSKNPPGNSTDIFVHHLFTCRRWEAR